jgi:large repetitive protein
VLRPGTYQIVETAPGGYLAGATTVGTVNGSTDGTAVSTGTIGTIALTSGQNGVNYLFGEVQPVIVSGMVYMDLSESGVFSAGDTAFAGVTLTLSGTNGLGQAVSATTTSAANGTYSFSTDSHGNVLLPGTYQIAETTPSGYVETAANIGTVNGVLDGSKTTAGAIASIAMTSGQNGINYNFGLDIPASVSGYVYMDFDRDGKFDNADTGIAGATLTLTGTTVFGVPVNLTVTTDANGFYIFAGLTTGTYSISVTPPGGANNPGAANVGTVNGNLDGVANENQVEIDQVQLYAGQSGLNYNFGVLTPFE